MGEGGRGCCCLEGGEGNGINGLLSHPSLYINSSPLSKHPHPLPPPHNESISTFFSSNNFLWREHQRWKTTQSCILFSLLISFDFKFKWVSRSNKCSLTSSILSGSDAHTSHLLYRMKMYGLERCWFLLSKKFFSCKWQGYKMRNYPTSMGRFNMWMLPHWLDKFLL